MGKRRKNRNKVPEVLYRLFNNRAKTLSDTILSLIPPSTPSTCRCKGRRCLACTPNPPEFLLRQNDPSEYKKLLKKCFVVVNQDAPRVTDHYPARRWTQREIVTRTIDIINGDMIKGEGLPDFNVLCADFNRLNPSSTSLEILTCSPWDLLLRRVGDEFMFYLLKYTSIFLPSTRRNYTQVAGSSVSDLFFRTHRKTKPKSLMSSPVLEDSRRKRTRVDEADSAPKVDHSGASNTISCISCNTMRYSNSSNTNAENKKHRENLSREATSSTGTPRDNQEKVSDVEYQESQNEVNINPPKRRRVSCNSLYFSSSCSGYTENKKHQKNRREATLTTGTVSGNYEKLPNEEYHVSSDQIKTKKAQPRESSWRRKRKYRLSAIEDCNFHSQSNANANDSNMSSGSCQSAFKSTLGFYMRWWLTF